MKVSLRVRITSSLTVSIALVIFICWLLNKTLLGEFYLYTKINSLESSYEEINLLFEKTEAGHSLTEDEALNVERIELAKNVGIYLLTEQETYFGNKLSFLYPSVLSVNVNNVMPREYARVVVSINAYVTGQYRQSEISGIERIETSENQYDVFRLLDANVETEYIDLIGYLENGDLIFVRTNLESIQEGANISNKFLTYIGILAVILGSLMMFYISKNYTKPINDLSVVAKRMSDLDFDIKYQVTREDEIGELGRSINSLSEKLQRTISEFKSVNNELEKDIQNKIQIDELRKDFLSNVSHELKTPIALIQGYSEGLMENIHDDPESRSFYCEVIMDEAHKMNKMVSKLLTLNQIEFGNNQVEMERFDIVALIQSVLNATDILMKQKSVTLCFEQEEPVFVWADEYLIEEVVTNYVSNALNHVAGAKIIEIKLIQKEDVVRLAVYNTGEQIPEEELEKIWIKFYKVDKARTREYGGSGIGLSIVKAIATTHNKACGVINHENGVEFWFELDTKIEINTCRKEYKVLK